MIFIGDYFALGLVIVLCMFYFQNKHFPTLASKCYAVAIVITGVTIVLDLLSGILLQYPIPLWLNMAVNALYFFANILTTSSFAMFLFAKILEHVYDETCMVRAKRVLSGILIVYSLFIVANFRTGWLFYFDTQGAYCRGPLNAIGYWAVVLQMCFVLVCYFKHRKSVTHSLKRALLQTFPVILVCIVIQRVFPDIMLNGFIMSMASLVLFLNFQSQRQGVHTLTKLNDRQLFFREIENRLATGEPFQVLMIRLNNFAFINQKYGHKSGDEILYQFAFKLESLMRRSTAFHMNGTIFTLVFPCSDDGVAAVRSKTLINYLNQGISCFNEQFLLDYTVVDYTVDKLDTNVTEFYERLEYAATLARENKVPYIRYAPDIGERMSRRQYLMDRLRNIDREHGFQVWYQPIYCLGSKEFCSGEALLRLQESDGNIISPAELIPLAEQTGTVVPITWFVIEEVCRLLSSHSELEFLSVSVNLPMSLLLDDGFALRLNLLVDSYGIAHRRICLEFTERTIPDDFARAKASMERLVADGYRFYLDDFGVGHSNFYSLLQLPFSGIKLDMSLVSNIEDSTAVNRDLVKTLTGLFHHMDLTVIAEGAETARQVELLQEQGVDRIQGFFYARPMNAAALEEFYQKQKCCDK